MKRLGSRFTRLSPLGAAHNHFNSSRIALAVYPPGVPIRDGRLRTVILGHLGRIGLNLMPTIEAPNDEPHAGRGGVAEGHRRAVIGV